MGPIANRRPQYSVPRSQNQLVSTDGLKVVKPFKVAVIGSFLHAVLVVDNKVSILEGFHLNDYLKFAAMYGISEFVAEYAQKFLEEKMPFLKKLGDALPMVLTGGLVAATSYFIMGEKDMTNVVVAGGLAVLVSYFSDMIPLY